MNQPITKPSIKKPTIKKPSVKKNVVLVMFGIVAIAGALAVRSHYNAVAARSRMAYRSYQEREAIREKAETEAHANEQTLIRLRANVEAQPADLRARWALADRLQKFGLLQEAQQQLEAIARLDPASEAAAVGLANLKMASGSFHEAEGAYRSITQKWPKSIEGWQGLASAFFLQRLYREAGAAGRHALTLNPNDFGNQYIVASSALEYALEDPNEQETQEPLVIARGLLTRMVKEDPQNGEIQYKLGLTLFLMHNKKDALPYLHTAITLLPNRVNLAFDYAQILISVGNRAEARAFLTDAIARMPKMAGLYHLLSEAGQYDNDPRSIAESLRASQTAVALAPNTPNFWDRLGSSYLRAKDTENARKAFEKSLLLDPNRAFPYQQLAAIYTAMGQPKRATAAAQMATRMVSNDETLRHIEALSSQYPGDINLMLVRADRYRELKMFGPARDLYEQVLELQPGNAPALAGKAAIDKLSLPEKRVK